MGLEVVEVYIELVPVGQRANPGLSFCAIRVLRLPSWGALVEHREHLLFAHKLRDEDMDLVGALLEGELRGSFEEYTLNTLFWRYFVRDKRGLGSLAAIDYDAAVWYAKQAWWMTLCSCGHYGVQGHNTFSTDAGEVCVISLTRTCDQCRIREVVEVRKLLEQAGVAPQAEPGRTT